MQVSGVGTTRENTAVNELRLKQGLTPTSGFQTIGPNIYVTCELAVQPDANRRAWLLCCITLACVYALATVERYPFMQVATLRSSRVYAGMVITKNDIAFQPHCEEGPHAQGTSNQETHGEFRPCGRTKR